MCLDFIETVLDILESATFLGQVGLEFTEICLPLHPESWDETTTAQPALVSLNDVKSVKGCHAFKNKQGEEHERVWRKGKRAII